jgi:hypothetical protein
VEFDDLTDAQLAAYAHLTDAELEERIRRNHAAFLSGRRTRQDERARLEYEEWLVSADAALKQGYGLGVGLRIAPVSRRPPSDQVGAEPEGAD